MKPLTDHRKEVKIYGTRSSNYEYFKYHLNKELKKLGVKLTIKEVNNLQSIIDDKIEAIPSIRIGKDTLLSLEKETSLNGFLHTSVHSLLKEFNYGKMKKILVPFDYSNNAIIALEYAKSLAEETDSYITVIHYLHPQLPIQQDTLTKIQEDLNKITTHNNKLDNSSMSNIYIEGNIKKGLAGDQLIIDSVNYDLIVMGVEGTNRKAYPLLGSVSKRAINFSKAPVLLIPSSTKKFSLSNILYPAKKRIKKINHVKWLIEKLHPKIHILHFQKDEPHGPMIQELLPREQNLLSEESSIEMRYINDRTLDIASSILNYINEQNIDLLILEKSKESIGEFLIKKSITNKLINSIKIPTLVLHESL